MASSSPASLLQSRCANHPAREAAARCPACRKFFCRECVTEHDDRLFCASCLARLQVAGAPKRASSRPFLVAARSVLAFLFVWLFFYYVGQILLAIPSAFHEGYLWKSLARGTFE